MYKILKNEDYHRCKRQRIKSIFEDFVIASSCGTKKLPKQILDLAMRSLTVLRKFTEILNLLEQKDSYHTP